MRDDLPRRAVGRSEACGRAVVTSVNPTDYPVPTQNRRVLLVRRPTGIPVAADFALSTAPVPELAPGTFLVRNLYLSVDPAQRGWAADGHNYSAGVQLGATMRALAVGVVVKTAVEGVREGELLYGWFGWQQLCLAGPTDILLRATFDVPATAYLSLLGINGLAAFLALHDVGRPVAGNTLLVSTAAGSVGSFVGQIGALRGCRTVGLTGSDEKARRCRELGADAVANYRSEDWVEVAKQATGGRGVDVVLDSIGGSYLDGNLRALAEDGRLVLIGLMGGAKAELPLGALLSRRLSVIGSTLRTRSPSAKAAIVTAFQARFGADFAAGRIRPVIHRVFPLAEAPEAHRMLKASTHFGKVVLRVRDDER